MIPQAVLAGEMIMIEITTIIEVATKVQEVETEAMVAVVVTTVTVVAAAEEREETAVVVATEMISSPK